MNNKIRGDFAVIACRTGVDTPCCPKRRELLLAAAALPALAVVRPVLAQPARIHRIGWLFPGNKGADLGQNAFRGGLAELGYVIGRNITIDEGWGENSAQKTAQVIVEIAGRRPEVIVAQGPALFAARKLPGKTPIVFAFSGDAVEAGVAQSYSRPGLHFTGISFMQLDLVGKRIELLREIVPKIKRLAVLGSPNHPGEKMEIVASREAASRFGIQVFYYPVSGVSEIKAALASSLEARVEAVVVHPNAGMILARGVFSDFSLQHRVPTISGWAEFSEGGNLASYGPNLQDGFKRVAYFVDRILKGANPADLPIELPRRVELVINLKIANALGITISQALLLRADKVID